MAKEINSNLLKLAELTYNSGAELDEEISRKIKKQNKSKKADTSRKSVKLPDYFTEHSNAIEKNKSVIQLGSYETSGCSGGSTYYTINIDGKTADGRGFHYKNEFGSRERREKDIKAKKKDLEKVVSEVKVDRGF